MKRAPIINLIILIRCIEICRFIYYNGLYINRFQNILNFRKIPNTKEVRYEKICKMSSLRLHNGRKRC